MEYGGSSERGNENGMVCGDIAGSAFAIVLCSFPPIQASTMLAFFVL